jgi:hypothetical protein
MHKAVNASAPIPTNGYVWSYGFWPVDLDLISAMPPAK